MYRIGRDVTRLEGAFQSATAWEWDPSTQPGAPWRNFALASAQQYAYIAATSSPTLPTGTSDTIPDGWAAAAIAASADAHVYRVVRARRTRGGVFESATAWAWNPSSQPGTPWRQALTTTRQQHAYRRGAVDTRPTLPTSRAEAIPTGWAATNPSSTHDMGVYRVARTVTERLGAFVSATAWAWSPAANSQPWADVASDKLAVHQITVQDTVTGAEATVSVLVNADVEDGEAAINTALVTAWKRSASEPTDSPADGAVYTFDSGTLTGTLNGWVVGTPPSGTNRLWARVASVRDKAATATIDASDWSGVVHDEGADGISSANVNLYQRADSEPSAPVRSVRHTFATGATAWTGAGTQNGWKLNIAGTASQTGKKLWIAHASAAGDGATDDIPSSEWSIGELAEDGAPGASGASLNTIYIRSATQPSTPAAATDDIPTGWADDPPTGTNQLWASNGNENQDTNVWTWRTPRKAFERTDAPTAAIAATGDDVRVTVTDPTDTTGIIGHRIDLEKLEGGDWRTVDTVTHVGLTTSTGRGKTFAELPAGSYRAEVQTAVAAGFIESSYVVSATVTSAGGTVTADNIPSAPPTPTAVYSQAERTITVGYQDPASNGGSHLVAFLTELYKDGTLSGNRIAAERKGVLQGRDYIFREITEAGVYYARVAALNANNGSPAAVTTDKNWTEFSAPVVVGDAQGILNKVTVLGLGATYQFVAASDDAVFRLVSGEGSLTEEGFYTAPDGPASGIRIGLFEGGKEVDFNEISVVVNVWTLPLYPDGWNTNSRSSAYTPFRGNGLDYRDGSTTNPFAPLASPRPPPPEVPTRFLDNPPAGQLVGMEDFRVDVIDPRNYARTPPNNTRGRILITLRTYTHPLTLVDFIPSFENTGTIRFDMLVDGTLHTALFRCKGLGADGDATNQYIWIFTEAENRIFWNLFNGTIGASSRGANRYLVDEGSSISFVPDRSQGTPAGTITNKITDIDEGDSHAYEISGLAGGVASFVEETPGVRISLDGVLNPNEVSATTAADAESIGLYVRGVRVDGDAFRINAVSEKGAIGNKISQLYAHQTHWYDATGVQGGTVSYRVKSGPGEFNGRAYSVDLAFEDEVHSPTTVVVEQIVGGVVTDDDTFTLFPSIASIANKIDTLDPDQTHQFRPAANRASGAITWQVSGSGTVDASGVYTPVAEPAGYSAIVTMLLDAVAVDAVTFFVRGTTGNLTVRITNPVETIRGGQNHRFLAEVRGRNLTGTRTITWYALKNPTLFGNVVKQTDELEGLYTAPDTVTGQGFSMSVQVIVDQDDTDGNSHTAHATAHFWVTPSFALQPPTLEIFVTQDDVRVIVFDPDERFRGRSGYRLRLQKKSGSSWTNVETVNIAGDAGSQGAGRTFNNLGVGTYRGAALTTATAPATNSAEVFTEEVEVTQDFPDLIAGAPPKPTMVQRGSDLVIDYQDPSEDGGTHLIRFAVEVYRDGTERANRIGRAQIGTRLGRQKVFYNFAGIAGTYRTRVAAVNANSQDGGPLNWSPMSDPLVVT